MEITDIYELKRIKNILHELKIK